MNWHDFWTNENNPSLENYLYGTRHIIILCATLFLCVLLSVIFFKRSDKTKRILFYIFGIIFILFEITSRVVNLVNAKTYTFLSVLKILLPEEICSVFAWVLIVCVFTKRNWFRCFGVVGGLIATLVFLLFPQVGFNHKYIYFTQLYSVAMHALGFVCAVLFLTLKQVHFEFKKIWITYICFVILFGWGALLNFVIFPGENFMFMVKDPTGINWPIPYQIIYLVGLSLYIAGFYLVAWLIQKLTNKHSNKSV